MSIPNPTQIRNFAVISHIDHGKSTLADRFLELTGTVEARKMHPQYLDRMGLEQERGITIKMQPVRMVWSPNHAQILNPKSESRNNFEFRNSNFEFSDSTYTLNLIDTPGHVDFSYEVSRALAAVEGAILLVDATKGIQAQTLANLELAQAQGLTVVAAVNKIDSPQARTQEVREEVAAILRIQPQEVSLVSAKEGTGVAELLVAAIERIPPPKSDADSPHGSASSPRESASVPLRALVFDSEYDDYRGVVAHIRVMEGEIRARDRIRFLATSASSECIEVGAFRPDKKAETALSAGDIGYVVTGLKDPNLVRIGDTLSLAKTPGLLQPLPGYREPQPVVYAALFPENADEFDHLRDALGKLRLNDAALTAFPEESHALGRGFRCGFLGTLHLEIVVERLHREWKLELVVTQPSVVLIATLPTGKLLEVRTPRDFPQQYSVIREPWVRMEMLVPPDELASALRIVNETRGTVEETDTITPMRLRLRAAVPLLDVVEDFADRLKSATRGYASFSWQPIEPRAGDLVKLTVFVAHDEVEALARIVPRSRAEAEARKLTLRLKEALPQQLFAVAIQVAADGRIIARETIAALRKDVTAPLYGGDFTRKKKLLVKQRKGKKRLEKMGRVEIPPETFLKILKRQ